MHRRFSSNRSPETDRPQFFSTYFEPETDRTVVRHYPSVYKPYKTRYPYRSISDGPNFAFSRATRLAGDDLETKVRLILAEPSKSAMGTYFVELNKDPSRNSPAKRHIRLKSLNRTEEVRVQLFKDYRERSYQLQQAERKFMFREKLRKLDLRLNKDECIQVKKSWLALYALVGAVHTFQQRTGTYPWCARFARWDSHHRRGR